MTTTFASLKSRYSGYVVIILLIVAIFTLGGMAINDKISHAEATQKKAEAVHERIVATTYDVSGGTDTVRARQSALLSGGNCTLHVQRYSRQSQDYLYTDSPTFEMYLCER